MSLSPAITDEPTQNGAVLYLRVSTKEQAERGGESEGFSIPAQRDAGHRKAAALHATVVREFVDAGESARSADRKDLQQMLLFLTEHPVKYVIVHKVDRLARNRVDDVAITVAIRQAGATLASCTENIDETPSGALLHGIMSSIAEFYSRNLASEVVKGMEQKARSGGTTSLTPIGYLNVRRMVDGREARVVELDPERAPLIAWAFRAYADGEWSIYRLAHELEVRGLTQRPTAKRPARPLNGKKLAQVLHNPYYMGVVTWRGVQFDGKHPPLVDPALFARVQEVLAAHRQSGERSYRRKHYLAGTLYCGRCKSKLIYSVSTGKQGESYAYWLCLGRHTYKNGCDLPYMQTTFIEEEVTQAWAAERLSEQQAAAIRDSLLTDLASYAKTSQEAAERLNRRLAVVERDRRKWAEKAFDGSVPPDIAQEKQAELTRQLAGLHGQRAGLTATTVEHEAVIRDAAALLPNCGAAYRRGDANLRRDYNQAWFEQILVDCWQGRPQVSAVTRTELFAALRGVEVESAQTPVLEEHSPADVDGSKEQLVPNRDEVEAKAQREQPGRFRARVVQRVTSSNVALLVELRGLEPLTPTLPGCLPAIRPRPQTSVPAGRTTPGPDGRWRTSADRRVLATEVAPPRSTKDSRRLVHAHADERSFGAPRSIGPRAAYRSPGLPIVRCARGNRMVDGAGGRRSSHHRQQPCWAHT